MEELVETSVIRATVIGKNADDFIDQLYCGIKKLFLMDGCGITIEHLEDLSEQLMELALRKKEERGGE